MEPGDSRGLQRGGEAPLPKPVRDLITKARTSWLKNTEVLDLLQNYSKYRFQLNRETPICPPGEFGWSSCPLQRLACRSSGCAMIGGACFAAPSATDQHIQGSMHTTCSEVASHRVLIVII